MAPEAMVRATQSWLQSSWHVQVPFAWLEACVEWLQEEAGGAGLLSQQQINQQSLDQWLLTDLRDLDHPVLPAGLAQAQMTELRGIFCVQVDSLLDISQPVYGQLQKWKGTDCANDEVSAVTQTTQRPWEARPTRMLLLQVTDGVQNLEAMEYQPVPALSTALRPGVKLQLQGQMVCRLGVLLLGPSNIRVLGGEVEDLVDRNNQGRVLCRTLGLPEEQQQQDEEGASPSHRATQEVDDMELDDQELLASLEAQEEVERVRPVGDSGYVTVCETSTQSSRSSSARMFIADVSSTSETSAHSSRGGLTQSSRVGSFGSVEGRHSNGPEDTDLYRLSSSDHMIQQEMMEHSMVVEDFPEEDFDDLPLDELDSVIFQENTDLTTQSTSGPGSTADSRTETDPNSSKISAKLGQTAQHHLHSKPLCSSAPSEPPRQSSHTLANDGSDVMDDDMDCLIDRTGEPDQPPHHPQRNGERDGAVSSLKPTGKQSRSKSSPSVPQEQGHFSSTAESDRTSAENARGDDITAAVVTLTSRPFTYLSLFEELVSRPRPHVMEICVKAFIVTLLGNLSGKSGLWRVCATISDGTGYLDVELSNEVLTGMLGFSVAEKGALKRNPARRSEFEAGMKRCQEELVDMCCVMTIAVEPGTRKAVVMKADPVSEEVYQQLEQRVRGRRK